MVFDDVEYGPGKLSLLYETVLVVAEFLLPELHASTVKLKRLKDKRILKIFMIDVVLNIRVILEKLFII